MAAATPPGFPSKAAFLEKLGDLLAQHGSQAADVRALLALPQVAANTDWRAEAEKLLKERQAFEGLLGGGQPKSSILATVARWGWAVLTAPRLQGAVVAVVLGVLGYFGLDFWQRPQTGSSTEAAIGKADVDPQLLTEALRKQLENLPTEIAKDLKQSFQAALEAELKTATKNLNDSAKALDEAAKASVKASDDLAKLDIPGSTAKKVEDTLKATDLAVKVGAKVNDDLAKLDIPGNTAKKVEEKLNAADLAAKVSAKVSMDLKDLPDKTAKKVEETELIKKIAAKLEIK